MKGQLVRDCEWLPGVGAWEQQLGTAGACRTANRGTMHTGWPALPLSSCHACPCIQAHHTSCRSSVMGGHVCDVPPAPAVAVMMYGFGDDVSPLPETLDLVEDIVLDYASTLMRKVSRVCCQMLMDGARRPGGHIDSALGCASTRMRWVPMPASFLGWLGGGRHVLPSLLAPVARHPCAVHLFSLCCIPPLPACPRPWTAPRSAASCAV